MVSRVLNGAVCLIRLMALIPEVIFLDSSYLTDRGLVFECVTSFYCLLTPFSSEGQKLFKPYLKKYTWLVYNRDDNLCIVKSEQKLIVDQGVPMQKYSLKYCTRSVDMVVFKNTKWSPCVYMMKNITQTVRGDLFLIKI